MTFSWSLSQLILPDSCSQYEIKSKSGYPIFLYYFLVEADSGWQWDLAVTSLTQLGNESCFSGEMARQLTLRQALNSAAKGGAAGLVAGFLQALSGHQAEGSEDIWNIRSMVSPWLPVCTPDLSCIQLYSYLSFQGKQCLRCHRMLLNFTVTFSKLQDHQSAFLELGIPTMHNRRNAVSCWHSRHFIESLASSRNWCRFLALCGYERSGTWSFATCVFCPVGSASFVFLSWKVKSRSG